LVVGKTPSEKKRLSRKNSITAISKTKKVSAESGKKIHKEKMGNGKGKCLRQKGGKGHPHYLNEDEKSPIRKSTGKNVSVPLWIANQKKPKILKI